MSLLSNSCQMPAATQTASDINQYAEKLACLLIDTPEFQEYLRLERAVSLDPQVSEIRYAIHSLQMSYFSSTDDDGNNVDSLSTQLEALPLMIEFRQAEQAVRTLFTAVDQVIGQASGIEFAANARKAFT